MLITGASSGIGQAIALAYAAPGVHLYLTARNEERLRVVKTACEEKGAIVDITLVDVTEKEKLAAWILASDDQTPIDLVIANAGISSSSSGEQAGADSLVTQQKLFDVNLQGTLNTVFPILPRMQARQSGHIALMSSMSAFRGLPRSPAYSATKAALKVYGEAMGARWGAEGINFSVICPGFIKTPLTDRNAFPMPFKIGVEKAATIISRGLAKRKPLIAFPWRMHAVCYLLSILPTPLAQKILRHAGR